MRLENDNVLNELYDEEFGKIPFIFRFSRKLFIIAFVTICILLFTTVALIFAFYGNANSQGNITTALLFTGVALCLLVVWVIIGKLFEDRAFKKASHLAQMIHISEHRLEMRRWEKIRTDSRF